MYQEQPFQMEESPRSDENHTHLEGTNYIIYHRINLEDAQALHEQTGIFLDILNDEEEEEEEKEDSEKTIALSESRGFFGSLLLARDIKTKKFYAVKKIEDQDAILEINIHGKLSGLPNIMPLENSNTTQTQEKRISYLFMPIIGLWNGDSLSRYLAELTDEAQITNIVREIAWQLLNALQQMHTKNFAHLDITLANFVLDKEGNLYLIDFGLATEIVDGKAKFGKANKLNEEYACPEFMWKAFFHRQEKFDSFDALIADRWAVGLILMDLILKGSKPILKHKYEVGNVSEFYDKFPGVQPNEVLKNWILDVKRFISDFLDEEWPKQDQDDQIKFFELRFIIEKLMIEPEQFTLEQVMGLPFFDSCRTEQFQPIWSRAFIQEGVSSTFTDCEDNKPNRGYKTVSDMPIIEQMQKLMSAEENFDQLILRSTEEETEAAPRDRKRKAGEISGNSQHIVAEIGFLAQNRTPDQQGMQEAQPQTPQSWSSKSFMPNNSSTGD